MSAVPPEDVVAPAPVRVVPRKLSLRVSGARPGSVTRPLDSTTPVMPSRVLGLRVHSSPLAPRPTAPTVIDPSDYATAEDYE